MQISSVGTAEHSQPIPGTVHSGKTLGSALQLYRSCADRRYADGNIPPPCSQFHALSASQDGPGQRSIGKLSRRYVEFSKRDRGQFEDVRCSDRSERRTAAGAHAHYFGDPGSHRARFRRISDR